MRRLHIYILLSFLSAALIQAQTKVESKIESAKVFTRGAEITRSAQLSLTPGIQQLELNKLSPRLDPKTVQITGEHITILSVRHEMDFLDKQTPERVKKLWGNKYELEDSLEILNVHLGILESERDVLNKNTKVIGSQGISDKDYQAAIQFFTDKLKTNAESIFKISKSIERLQNQIDDLQSQIISINNNKEEPTSKILLTVKSEQAQKVDITISYSMLEAGWIPSYDIRAMGINEPLEITYKAQVYQNSGIDWKKVKLTLSSGDIESTGTAPQLNPYYLGGRNFNVSSQVHGSVSGYVFGSDDGLPLPQATVLVKGTTVGTATDMNGFFSMQVPSGSSTLVFRFLGYVTQEAPISNDPIQVKLVPDATSLGEVVVVGYGEAVTKKSITGSVATLSGTVPGIRVRGAASSSYSRPKKTEAIPVNLINYETTFVYDIELPYDIPTTGKPETVDIQTKSIEASYHYSTSPKIKENAYLVAEIPDWENLKLLDGESNLYFENSFVGKSLIDNNIGTDTLSVSLGKDEGIIVNRERLKQFEKQKFFGNKKREERKYKITIVNTKSSKAAINIFDQIPLSAVSYIKVSINSLGGADYNEETGLLSWSLELKAGEKRELEFSYEIDCPVGTNIDSDL
ncbi:MAG: mucoidy inhibitor MuiA family protein [Cytophagia bacterium]|nr:mucoidy inhibitor MuiA family protein [Cytophagia bacterium]